MVGSDKLLVQVSLAVGLFWQTLGERICDSQADADKLLVHVSLAVRSVMTNS